MAAPCNLCESASWGQRRRRIAVLAALLAASALIPLPGSITRSVAGAEPAKASDLQKYSPTVGELEASYQRAQRGGQVIGKVYKAQIAPNWFHHNTRFWYRNDLRGGEKEFVLVDAERGRRAAAFDHARLASALTKAAGADYPATKLPFDSLEFVDDDKAIRFNVGNTAWRCDLSSYECAKSERSSNDGPRPRGEIPSRQAAEIPGAADSQTTSEACPLLADSTEPSPQEGAQPQRSRELPAADRSPDGKWSAFVKESNVFLRPLDGEKEFQLTRDGKESSAYGMLRWSPDSQTLAAFRIEPGERKDVYLIESSPRNGGRARLQSRPYPLPGDKLTTYELHLFHVADQQEIKLNTDKLDFDMPRLRWKKDGHAFTFEKVDRGHQRFRLIEVNTHSGSVRNLIDEQAKTFIWTAHLDGMNWKTVNYLDKTDEIIHVSERDRWRHLYLVDAREGQIKNRITQGDWVVRGVDRIDEEKRQIWFRASGKNAGQDPYLVHYYRVNFDGSGLVALTEANGNHSVQYSPDHAYLVDTYSRVDTAPAHELRRASDGKLVCELEKADITELQANGWTPPEVFTAKGRDGKTDIWGIICRPGKFDPAKKYPVIEQIYAGPQGSFVPKTFSPVRRFAALTELGFIVVQIDGMGTANRSKAFHDVCWHNLKDAGFPDRILWHQAVAKKYQYYDLSRVGIYGGSAGGQNATAGVLFHPEFYKAAVSGCGCHDNRMDKASWNEQWMGYPVGPQYAECSNIDNAFRLRGKLLLIVGELDTNVPPESTLRLVDALIKAGKDFEMLVVPGAGHGMGGVYGNRRLQDFFVRHLHGVEPPDRNAVARKTTD